MGNRDKSAMYGANTLDGEVKLPVKFEVCPVCVGKGSHVNPSIDAHGISAEEFQEDPDFRDDYMSGKYDVPCYECHGLRVVEVVDRENCDPELLKEYDEEVKSELEYQAICEAERKMGA